MIPAGVVIRQCSQWSPHGSRPSLALLEATRPNERKYLSVAERSSSLRDHLRLRSEPSPHPGRYA